MIFQCIACIILIAFYSCYLIKLFTQKKQGIQTNQLGKGKQGTIKFIEIAVKCATFLVLIVEILSIFLNSSLSPLYLKIIGIVLGIIGVLIFIIAVLDMKDSWRAGIPENEKTELVTHGIYQISRNPAFLGFDLMYLGILCIYFNIPLLITSLIAIVFLHLQITKVEESFLINTFGTDYLNYQKKVCRYWGHK